ncbi:TH1 protein domain-containing protein [Ditylenchus destructor]|uniref:TH1 protein domain-containing protein n=1 Tax=Ditylenchus destructor TaxID=166010 RepID=A0AAD4NEG9_9BILA|nr:TH1 protein domain-containing protein [Ditylenchus destructor]
MEESLTDVELIQEHCAELFSLKDFVMEPQVISTLLAFFQAGGQPQKVINLLSDNYHAYGTFANLLGCWLADLEMDDTKSSTKKGKKTKPSSSTSQTNMLADAQTKIESCAVVRDVFESSISAMISKIFHPESADKIFELEGDEGIDWLPELISHRPWRRLIYQLSEHYPNCLMLNFAVKLISDAGFQHEISNVNTAAQQLDIFSRVFLSSVDQVLMVFAENGPNSEAYEKVFSELVRVACHSEQTFLYTQALFHVISFKESGKLAATCAHIRQSLRLVFEKRGQDDISSLYISMIQSDTDMIPANVVQAMLTMNAKQALNPADINQLYQAYFEPCPPPVDLIRDPFFVNMLTDALFNTSTPKVHTDHRYKYVYLLSYATCVGEMTRNGIRVQSKIELDTIRQQMDQLVQILESSDDLLLSLPDLLKLVKLPILAAGVLHYIKNLLMREDYLSEPQPVHFALFDQVVSNHVNLHSTVFKVLCELYDYLSSSNEVAVEMIMERQRNIIDRFVHLLFCGSALLIVEKLTKMFKDGQVDVSLVRYFALEVLELIEGPYSREFLGAFLPIVANPEVFDQSALDKNLPVKEFIENGVAIMSSAQ